MAGGLRALPSGTADWGTVPVQGDVEAHHAGATCVQLECTVAPATVAMVESRLDQMQRSCISLSKQRQPVFLMIADLPAVVSGLLRKMR